MNAIIKTRRPNGIIFEMIEVNIVYHPVNPREIIGLFSVKDGLMFPPVSPVRAYTLQIEGIKFRNNDMSFIFNLTSENKCFQIGGLYGRKIASLPEDFS